MNAFVVPKSVNVFLRTGRAIAPEFLLASFAATLIAFEMGAAISTNKIDGAFPTVLLCFPGDAQASAKLLNEPHCGKPLLFHQLMHWHSVGASKILLSIETMPGSLVSVIDDLASRGVLVELVRSPAEVIAQLGETTRTVIAKADIWFSAEVINRAAAAREDVLVTVDESSENADFERIDLNSRWAGIGSIDRKILLSMSDMPDGWDMASSLLRQSLQYQAELARLRQSDLLAGQAGHLTKTTAYESFFHNSYHPRAVIESMLFKPITRKVSNLSWQSAYARHAAMWAFPALALLSLSIATIGQLTAAAVVAVLAIWTADIRSFVLAAEYEEARLDVLKLLGWIGLVLTVAGALYLDGEIPFDAILLAGLLAGLSLQTQRSQSAAYVSPLVIAGMILIGAMLGWLAIMVKLVIALQLIMLLILPTIKIAGRLKPN